jgi:hypothetical protein
MILPRSVLLRMRNVSDKRCRENENTYFMLNNFIPNTVPFTKYYGQASEENITRSMRCAWWKTKGQTHIQNMKYHCFSTETVVMRTRLNVTLTRTLLVFLSFTVTRTVLMVLFVHRRCRTKRILGPQMYFWIGTKNMLCFPCPTITSCGYMSTMVTFRKCRMT